MWGTRPVITAGVQMERGGSRVHVRCVTSSGLVTRLRFLTSASHFVDVGVNFGGFTSDLRHVKRFSHLVTRVRF